MAPAGFSASTTGAAFLLVLSGLAVPLPVAGSLQWSQVVLAGVIALWFLGSLFVRRAPFSPFERTLFLLGLVLAACGSAAVLTFGPGERLLSEGPKLALLFFGALALSAIAHERLFAFLPWAALTSAGAIFASWFLTTSRYEYGGRLQLPEFGSPNTLGFMIAVIVVILVLTEHGEGTGRFVLLVRWPVIAVLLWFLFETTSRGGFFALAAGLFLGLLLGRFGGVHGRSGKWVTTALIAAGAGAGLFVLSSEGFVNQVLARLNLAADNSSSGRTTIWLELLRRQFESVPAMLFGYGPGSIDLNFMNKTVTSAHSMVMTMFVYFGVVGLIGFVVLLIRTWRRAISLQDPHSPVRIGLLAALTLSFAVDSVALSTQGALMAGLALAATGIHPSEKPAGLASDDDSAGRQSPSTRGPGRSPIGRSGARGPAARTRAGATTRRQRSAKNSRTASTTR